MPVVVSINGQRYYPSARVHYQPRREVETKKGKKIHPSNIKFGFFPNLLEDNSNLQALEKVKNSTIFFDHYSEYEDSNPKKATNMSFVRKDDSNGFISFYFEEIIK